MMREEIKPSDHFRRKSLEDYFGQTVLAEGIFEGSDMRYCQFSNRQNRVCLVNDVRITTDEEQFDVGHMWVQRANAIKNVNPVIGEKIAFYARVNKYQYRNHVVSKDGIMVETRYGLENPSDVEVLTPSHYRAGEPREPAVVSSKTAPVAALDTIEAIKVAKSLLVDLGAELVLSALPQLERLTEASAKLGGASRLREMVEVLR